MSTKNSTQLVVLGLVVFLAIAGVFVYTVFNQQNTTPATNNSTSMTQEEGVMVGGAMMVKSKNIVQNAANANNVTTLVSAVKAAGLDTTLSGTGPFTVFAPTNSAFDKLPAGTVNTLLKPENKTKLTNILTYHVVSGNYRVSDLMDGMMLKTVNGQELKISKSGDDVMVNGIKIQTKDVISSNGVTHVIDSVLMPEDVVMVAGAAMFPTKNIIENVVNAPNLTTLVSAVKAADLVTTLQGPGPFTVFGPTNDAFAKVDQATLQSLLMPENKAKLQSVLTYHVVPGIYKNADLTDGLKLKTVNGKELTFTRRNNTVMINNSAMIQTPDVNQSNGVAHVIDTVLIP